MDNLIFSLNATVPVFLLMVLGLVLRKLNWIDDVFASKMNQFVFKVPLPLLVFLDLATVDFEESWNFKFVAFCFVVTLISISLSAGISMIWKGPEHPRGVYPGVLSQQRGDPGDRLYPEYLRFCRDGALMIIGSVPLYNMMAVVVLSVFKPGQTGLNRQVVKKTLTGIVTNPIIIGIAAGLLWSAFRLPMAGIPEKVISNVADTATPLGLMAMGASFDLKKGAADRKACGDGGCDQTGRILRGFPAGRNCPGLPRRRTGGDFDYAGICHDRQLLCDGEKYGA